MGRTHKDPKVIKANKFANPNVKAVARDMGNQKRQEAKDISKRSDTEFYYSPEFQVWKKRISKEIYDSLIEEIIKIIGREEEIENIAFLERIYASVQDEVRGIIEERTNRHVPKTKSNNLIDEICGNFALTREDGAINKMSRVLEVYKKVKKIPSEHPFSRKDMLKMWLEEFIKRKIELIKIKEIDEEIDK